MTTVVYNNYGGIRTRERCPICKCNVIPWLMAALVGLLLWRLGPAAAIGACAIILGRRVGAGRTTGVTEWIQTAARVRVASVTFGVALILASAFVQMPAAVNSVADLRGAVGYLAVQCLGVLGAPMLALLSVQSLRKSANRGRRSRPVRSLSHTAKCYMPVRTRIAA